jgi:uncharacterized protein (UPF0335 family)
MVKAKKSNVERDEDDMLGDESAGIGHNSGNESAQAIRSILERVERLMEEKKELQRDITEIFQEAKGRGFEPKILRQLIKLRAMAEADRQEQNALLAVYASAIGMEV